MKKWFCIQKTFCDPAGGQRKQVYKVGDHVSLPDDVTLPRHTWCPEDEYRAPPPPEIKPIQMAPTVFEPSTVPVDDTKLANANKGVKVEPEPGKGQKAAK